MKTHKAMLNTYPYPVRPHDSIRPDEANNWGVRFMYYPKLLIHHVAQFVDGPAHWAGVAGHIVRYILPLFGVGSLATLRDKTLGGADVIDAFGILSDINYFANDVVKEWVKGKYASIVSRVALIPVNLFGMASMIYECGLATFAALGNFAQSLARHPLLGAVVAIPMETVISTSLIAYLVFSGIQSFRDIHHYNGKANMLNQSLQATVIEGERDIIKEKIKKNEGKTWGAQLELASCVANLALSSVTFVMGMTNPICLAAIATVSVIAMRWSHYHTQNT